MNLTFLCLPFGASDATMRAKRDKTMTIKRSFLVLAAMLAAASLSGCIAIYEGTDAVCPHGDPNAADWPYCGTAEPGGTQPGNDRPDYY